MGSLPVSLFSQRHAQLICFSALILQIAPAVTYAGISLDKNSYQLGETIHLSFHQAPGGNGDWVCIVPQGAQDTEAGDYQYIPKGLTEGKLQFSVTKPGSYEARIYYDYRHKGYTVGDRVIFSVGEKAAVAAGNTSRNHSNGKQSSNASGSGSPSTVQSITSASGQAYMMVGDTMTKLGDQYEGSTMGTVLKSAGKFHSDVGRTLDNAGRNNTSPGQTFAEVNTTAYKSLQSIRETPGGGKRADTDVQISRTKNTDILAAQKTLQKEGYYTGQIDGIFGKNTSDAIKKYQQDNNLPASGELDETTKASLEIR